MSDFQIVRPFLKTNARFQNLVPDFQFLRSNPKSSAQIENPTLNFQIVRPIFKTCASVTVSAVIDKGMITINEAERSATLSRRDRDTGNSMTHSNVGGGVVLPKQNQKTWF